MNLSSRIVAAALVATIPWGVVACGNDQSAHAKASLKAWTVKNLSSNDGSMKLTDAQAGCFANTVVDKVGVKELRAQKVLDKNATMIENALDNTKLPVPDATVFGNAIIDCTGNGAPFITAITSSLKNGAPDAVKTCIDSKVTADVMRRFMIAGFSGATDPMGVLQAAVAPCEQAGN